MDSFAILLVLATKYITLVGGIAYGASVLGDLCHGNAVHQTRMFLMSAFVGTFIFLQWII
jgi:hypothetical protein